MYWATLELLSTNFSLTWPSSSAYYCLSSCHIFSNLCAVTVIRDEQRLEIKFCTKAGKNAPEALQIIQNAHGSRTQ
jgi:hypothetical protein